MIASELYENEGYDVHAYLEDPVDPAYNEVVSAVQGRGVSYVAIVGYSHGGGATYVLADRLSQNAPNIGTFFVSFTAYIDAVIQNAMGPERRYPTGSTYHVNYWQPTPTGAARSHGASGTPPGQFDRNVQLDPWGTGLDHFSIDNHRMVLDRVKYGRGPLDTGDVHLGVTDLIPR